MTRLVDLIQSVLSTRDNPRIFKYSVYYIICPIFFMAFHRILHLRFLNLFVSLKAFKFYKFHVSTILKIKVAFFLKSVAKRYSALQK